MAVNAFTLFGEITVDTKKMQQALRDANKSLQDTKKAMEALNDVTAKNIPITNGAAKGEDNHKRGLKGSGEAARQKAKDMDALGKKMGGVGDKMQSFGTDMTYLVTAPILAAGAAALKTAIDFDRVRNQVNAAAGSFEAGAVQFQRLINIARTSPGVFVKSAASAYALLKQMEGLSDPSIEKSLKAMGRIKLANPEFDATEFARNLNQLITQGFEAQDVKQAMGRLPAFGPMLAEKFKLSGSDYTTVAKEMRQLVLQGKITGDEFMNAFGDAVLTHPIYSKLDDTLGDKFLKTFERIELALKPIGDRIGAVLLPAFTGLAMQIEKISAVFATLSPEMQNAIIGLATFVAAIGPVAGVVGTLIGVFAALLASIKFIAAFFGVTLTVAFLPFIKVVAIVVAAVAALAAIAYVAYQAYATNFAGIGDAINDVARILKELAAVSFDVLVGAIRPIVDALGDLWRENGKEIEYVISGIVLVLTALAYAVGQALIQFTKFVGTLMKLGGGIVGMLIDQFSLLIGVITDVGRFIVAVFTGDWEKASESAKNIVRGFAQWIGSFLGTIPGIIIGALQALFPEMERFFSDLRDKVIGFAYAVGGEWGGAIVDGIVNGIFGGAGRIASAVASASAGATPDVSSNATAAEIAAGQAARDADPAYQAYIKKYGKKPKRFGGMSGGGGGGASKSVSDYQQALDRLNDTIARFNVKTEEQGLMVDFAQNKIKGVTESQKIDLIQKARLLDLLNLLKTREDAAAAAKQKYTDTMASLTLEMALLNAMTDEHRISLELTAKEYADLTPEMIAAIKAMKLEILAETKEIEKNSKAFEDAIKMREQLNQDLENFISLNDKELTNLEKLEAWLKKNTEAGWQFDASKVAAARSAAKFADAAKLQADALSAISTGMQALGMQTDSVQVKIKELQAALGNTAALQQMADALGIAVEDLRAKIEFEISEAQMPTFAGQWKKQLDKMKESTQTFAADVAGTLANGMSQIGSVFGQAVAEWDGTAKGFFRSLAQGFRQLIQQIIQELIRLMVMRAVTSIIGAVGGSLGGSGNTVTAGGGRYALDLGKTGMNMPVFATGGFVTGPGTGTSDSIPAMLSNGEFVMPARAVRKFGVGFFEQLRNLTMPTGMMAMAGGGMVPSITSMGGSSSSSSASYNNVFNINVPPGAGSTATATMVQDNVLKALRKHERRNK